MRPPTPDEMRARLLRAEPPGQAEATDESYGAAIEYVGKLVLQAYERHPDLRDLPIETEFDWDAILLDDPSMQHPDRWSRHRLRASLTDEMKARGFHLLPGLSGNQVYEGIGAARFALGLGDLGNPAIVEVSTP